MYRVMSSDTGNSQARPLLERNVIPKGDSLFSWKDDILGRCPEWAIALSTEAPHALGYAQCLLGFLIEGSNSASNAP